MLALWIQFNKCKTNLMQWLMQIHTQLVILTNQCIMEIRFLNLILNPFQWVIIQDTMNNQDLLIPLIIILWVLSKICFQCLLGVFKNNFKSWVSYKTNFKRLLLIQIFLQISNHLSRTPLTQTAFLITKFIKERNNLDSKVKIITINHIKIDQVRGLKAEEKMEHLINSSSNLQSKRREKMNMKDFQ
jgi:hypothetical protein